MYILKLFSLSCFYFPPLGSNPTVNSNESIIAKIEESGTAMSTMDENQLCEKVETAIALTEKVS